MRVQCDGCERAEAVVVCCADEAALCRDCDIQVHDANKLASKHQRVPLFRPATATPCDICQEKAAYFFCLEDRALLCHNCDLSIHRLMTPSSVSNHRRFLVTGIAASLHTLSGPVPIAPPQTPPAQQIPSSQRKRPLAPKPKPPQAKIQPKQVPVISGASAPNSKKTSIFEFLTEGVPGWKCDDLLNNVPGDFIHDLQSPSTVSSFRFQVDQANSSSSSEQFYSRSVPQMSSSVVSQTGGGKYNNPEISWESASLMKAVNHPRTKPGSQDIFSLVPEADDAFVVPDLGLHSATPELLPHMKKRRLSSYYSELDNIFLS